MKGKGNTLPCQVSLCITGANSCSSVCIMVLLGSKKLERVKENKLCKQSVRHPAESFKNK